MLKSCSYCGRIHDRKYICPEKQKAGQERQRKASDKENRFRWGRSWKQKAKEIKERDLYLCQACMEGMEGTVRKYNPENLSVHHITKLREDYGRRLDSSNLITLCRMHHEMADKGKIPATALAGIIKEKYIGIGEQPDRQHGEGGYPPGAQGG